MGDTRTAPREAPGQTPTPADTHSSGGQTVVNPPGPTANSLDETKTHAAYSVRPYRLVPSTFPPDKQ